MDESVEDVSELSDRIFGYVDDQPQSNGHSEGKYASVHEEIGLWKDVSRSLRQYGLMHNCDKIRPGPSSSSYLLLDLPQSRSLRAVINTLMTDCDRRQNLLQDVIAVNAEIKAELKRQTEVSERTAQKSKDLKAMLETSRQRIQEMTEEKMLSDNVSNVEADRQRNTKDVAMGRVRQLESRCQQQEEEVTRLRRKIAKMTQEDAARQERQRELFHRLKRRPASKKASPMDDKVLDIIDAYERQLQELTKERELLGGGGDAIEKDDVEKEASVNYQALVKDLQRKLKSASDTIAALEEEKELLKLDLNSRPSVRDFNNAQIRLRRYEKLLRQHNIDIRLENRSERSGRRAVYSTALEDLDFLPLPQCQDYLRAVCQELDLSNLDAIVLTVKDLRRLAGEQPELVDFLHSVERILHSPSAPPLSPAFASPRSELGGPMDTPDVSGRDSESMRCRHLLSALEFWLDQLSALPELRASLFRLHNHLFPWRSQPPDVGQEICAMVGFVDSLVEYEADQDTHFKEKPSTTGKGNYKEACPENVANGLVSHFQRLFDCPRTSAVYTRMNDVYAKLCEFRTLFSNMKEALEMDPNASPVHVFEAVNCLCRAHANASEDQLRELLGSENLAKAFEKLEQYDDFFPTFRELVDDLLQLLELDNIDRILPAVRSLKRCADIDRH